MTAADSPRTPDSAASGDLIPISRRFYIRKAALSDDPDSNGRVLAKTMQACLEAGGGEVYMPPATYRIPRGTIPESVRLVGWTP